MMSRSAVFVLFLALGIETQLSYATQVSVNNTEGKLCLYADLMLNFSVTYEVTGNKSDTVTFGLPDEVTTGGSQCGHSSSTLQLHFGAGHSWTVAFAQKEETYQADSIVFAYNLSDSTLFPNSISNATVSVKVTPHITNVGMDTCYSCKSKEMFQVDAVNQTLWNALIQAFVSNGSKSENITSCAADLPATTVEPTTHVTNATTPVPATNATTPVPATNATTSTTPTEPPTTPTPSLPTPTSGKYFIKRNATEPCLLADFGLRLGFEQGGKYQEMNFEPNGTTVNGSCGANSSELVLISGPISIALSFASEAKKFHLHALNVKVIINSTSGEAFTGGNDNLTLWQAALGSSYMCNKEQNYTITNLLSIYTFGLQIQPFEVNKGVFSTAEECFLDSDLSFLVPIAVGVALSFLIILVLISYLIGRRKSRTGYQSV